MMTGRSKVLGIRSRKNCLPPNEKVKVKPRFFEKFVPMLPFFREVIIDFTNEPRSMSEPTLSSTVGVEDSKNGFIPRKFQAFISINRRQ